MHGIRRSFIVWWKVPLRRLAGSTERSGRHAWKGLFSYLAKKTDFFFLLRKKIRKVLRIRWHSPPFSVHPFSRNERGRNVLGSLAQLVEQLTLNQLVRCSSHRWPTSKTNQGLARNRKCFFRMCSYFKRWLWSAPSNGEHHKRGRHSSSISPLDWVIGPDSLYIPACLVHQSSAGTYRK